MTSRSVRNASRLSGSAAAMYWSTVTDAIVFPAASVNPAQAGAATPGGRR